MPLAPGTLLNNRYRIAEILGQGGMASVYRAIDENLGVDVAVKDNLFSTDEYARQFRREAVILANLRHTNLPRVTDHFVIEGQGQYLVMDYIEGEDLRQRMDRIGLISDDEAIQIGAAICDALTYLSTCNPPIVHRDIKPGNVRITPQGHIYLVDFGLAKDLLGTQITTTGARAMTPGYSPPEQYGTARTDQRTDIYSLGATLYATLTGYIPEDAMRRAVDRISLTPIRKFNPAVSRRLAMAVEKSLEVRPDDRYQTAKEFKRALLSASSPSRRLVDEYRVPPAPATPKETGPVKGASLVVSPFDVSPDSTPAQAFASSANRATNREGSVSVSRKGSRRWLFLVIGFAILVAGAAFIISNPSYNPLAPILFGPVTTSSATSTALVSLAPSTAIGDAGETLEPAMIVLSPTLMPSLTWTATNNPTLTPTLPPTALPTDTPTLTPSLTITPTPEPTRMGGSAGQVAFASEQTGLPQIWLVTDEGQLLRQITIADQGACQPAWSPNGKSLIFISPCDGNYDTYRGSGLFLIYDVDDPNSPSIPIMTEPGGDYDPAWSPDGTKIAFSSVRGTGSPRIFIMDLATRTVNQVSEQYKRSSQPAWSHDGKKIAYVSYEKGLNRIFMMNADGSEPQLITEAKLANDSFPSWSPNGKMLLFTQYNLGKGVPHLVIDLVEDPEFGEFSIVQGSFPAREASYSPDGFWLVFEAWPAGSNHDIYIMSTNGAMRRQLTNYPFNDFDPAWRPAIH